VTLTRVSATIADLAPMTKRMGRPILFLMGDAAFDNFAVDIDFAHHQIAFRDPDHVDKPAGGIEMPLRTVRGVRVVPASIEGAPTEDFWFGLGNAGELLIYQSYYEPNALLNGRRTSERQAGGIGALVAETVAVVRHVTFGGVTFGDMPAAFIPSAIAGQASDSVHGMIGTPILSRFRLIVDYRHDRLYAMPDRAAVPAAFDKDRLGLVLTEADSGYTVTFVAPHSPAESAGFKAGDRIASIDGKSAGGLTRTALTALRYGRAGLVVALTLPDGSVRRVTLADYF
jgi:hypothetical protein